MNYRHIYHAGNFADVMKHLALTLMLDRLQAKDTPLFVLDAHGGIGLYDLSSVQAQKTGEYLSGIGRFDGRDVPSDFARYDALVRDDLTAGRYPGSPLLLSRMLRPQDRMIANELHPEDAAALRQNLRRHRNVRTTTLDAYECIRAHIPPVEKRGLILIDPPFEKKDEFETLNRQMGEWKKRFAGGVYALWYPIKAHLPVGAMKEAARVLSLPRTWCAETLMHPREREDCFNGCGLVIFNAPFQVPEKMEALLPYLRVKMGLHSTVSEWLVPD